MWYNNFFHGLPPVAWRAAQTPDQDHAELELLVDTLEFGPGDHLLDVFCGYGRHALPLARMGAHVTGVDLSPDDVARLRYVAESEKLPLKILAGDFMTVKLPVATFDAAYCLGNSFSFFQREQMRQFLQRIAGALRPGGRFLAHTSMVAETLLPDFQERAWLPLPDAEGGPIYFLVEQQYDPIRSAVEQQLTYVQDGRAETRQATHYVYTLAELTRLFLESGFSPDITLLGDVNGRLFEFGDEEVWLFAERS